MKFINIEKNIIENKKLSNLSNTPPCPGINSLEFFKLFILLKYDSPEITLWLVARFLEYDFSSHCPSFRTHRLPSRRIPDRPREAPFFDVKIERVRFRKIVSLHDRSCHVHFVSSTDRSTHRELA